MGATVENIVADLLMIAHPVRERSLSPSDFAADGDMGASGLPALQRPQESQRKDMPVEAHTCPPSGNVETSQQV